jgi:hypothetical protein
MNDVTQPTEDMTPNETFEAVHNLKQKLEENFVALGQLLSLIKRKKLFRFKGYDNFKDFVETEYSINSTLAGKLCSVFELYITELDMDDGSVKEIGFDRLNMIKPYVAKAAWEIRDDWMQKAETMPIGELKEHIKEIKNKEKNTDKDVKDVLIDQYLEKMRTWFNCSQKELNFKLALYFQDADLEEIRKIIKERQRQFETELQTPKEVKE